MRRHAPAQACCQALAQAPRVPGACGSLRSLHLLTQVLLGIEDIFLLLCCEQPQKSELYHRVVNSVQSNLDKALWVQRERRAGRVRARAEAPARARGRRWPPAVPARPRPPIQQRVRRGQPPGALPRARLPPAACGSLSACSHSRCRRLAACASLRASLWCTASRSVEQVGSEAGRGAACAAGAAAAGAAARGRAM